MDGQSMDEPLDLIVLGAGVSGLTMAKNAAQRGLRVKLVEREGHVGGLWQYTDEGYGVMKFTHINVRRSAPPLGTRDRPSRLPLVAAGSDGALCCALCRRLLPGRARPMDIRCRSTTTPSQTTRSRPRRRTSHIGPTCASPLPTACTCVCGSMHVREHAQLVCTNVCACGGGAQASTSQQAPV